MRRLLQLILLTAVIVIVPLRSVYDFAAVAGDSDIWWHLRTGGWIVENHAFPHAGIFSQHPERHWMASSWGFEVLISQIFHAATNGLAALTVFLLALQALLAAVLFVCLERTSRHFYASTLLTLLVLYACNVEALRPTLFTMMFFALEVAILLAAEREGNARWLWWLVPLFVVWAGSDIHFVYGLAVVGIFAVAMSIGQAGSRRVAEILPAKIRPQTAWLILLACAAATCVGPYSVGIYQTTFGNVGNTGAYVTFDSAALSFRRPQHYVQLMLVLGALFAMGWKRILDPFRLLLVTSTMLVGFHSQGDAWFACITAGLVLAEAMHPAIVPLAPPERRERKRASWYFATTATSFLLAVAIATTAAEHRGLDTQTLIGAIDKEYPVGATSFVAQHRFQGPMYNTAKWGGYLIFNLREYPVSIDGRTDLYDSDLISRYAATANGSELENDADLQRAKFVLLERSVPLAYYLASDPHYKLVYADRLAVVLVKVK